MLARSDQVAYRPCPGKISGQSGLLPLPRKFPFVTAHIHRSFFAVSLTRPEREGLRLVRSFIIAFQRIQNFEQLVNSTATGVITSNGLEAAPGYVPGQAGLRQQPMEPVSHLRSVLREEQVLSWPE
jgi:hypothetical protein